MFQMSGGLTDPVPFARKWRPALRIPPFLRLLNVFDDIRNAAAASLVVALNIDGPRSDLAKAVVCRLRFPKYAYFF
jgi:hypothetical protein